MFAAETRKRARFVPRSDEDLDLYLRRARAAGRDALAVFEDGDLVGYELVWPAALPTRGFADGYVPPSVFSTESADDRPARLLAGYVQ